MIQKWKLAAQASLCRNERDETITSQHRHSLGYPKVEAMDLILPGDCHRWVVENMQMGKFEVLGVTLCHAAAEVLPSQETQIESCCSMNRIMDPRKDLQGFHMC